MAVEPGNPDHVAIGTEDGYVLTSTDGGTNWSTPVLVDAAGDPPALTDIDRLVISPFQVDGVRRIWALSSYTDWAYYSEDDGATWTPKNIQMSWPIFDLKYHDTIPGLLWAAVGGTYYSTDDGDTWTALNADIGEINHFALVNGAATRTADDDLRRVQQRHVQEHGRRRYLGRERPGPGGGSARGDRGIALQRG